MILPSRGVRTGGSARTPDLAIPLTIGVSLGMALFLMAVLGHGELAAFGFKSAPAWTIRWSLILGLGFGIVLGY